MQSINTVETYVKLNRIILNKTSIIIDDDNHVLNYKIDIYNLRLTRQVLDNLVGLECHTTAMIVSNMISVP